MQQDINKAIIDSLLVFLLVLCFPSKALACGGLNEKPCFNCLDSTSDIVPIKRFEKFADIFLGQCKEVDLFCLIGGAEIRDGLCKPIKISVPPTTIKVRELAGSFDAKKIDILNKVFGFVVEITNANGASFWVPDSSAIPPGCQKTHSLAQRCYDYKREAKDLTTDWTCNKIPSEVCGFPDYRLYPSACPQIGLKGLAGNTLTSAMYSIPEWSKLPFNTLKPPYIMINANWFNTRGPVNFPHVMPCSQIYGYSVSYGKIVSDFTVRDHQANELLDAFVVSNNTVPSKHQKGPYRLDIMTASELATSRRNKRDYNVQFAVGGFVIAKDGRRLPKASMPKATKAKYSVSRTAIGLSKDRKTAYIVVIQGGRGIVGIRPGVLSIYMTKELGASDVILLDGAGSSQFILNLGKEKITSIPGDLDAAGKPAFRPVPTALGIGGNSVKYLPKQQHKDELRKRNINLVSDAHYIGQYYSNDTYLSDDSRSAKKVSLNECSRRCSVYPNKKCGSFTYAFADKNNDNGVCTLFSGHANPIATTLDYRFYQLNR